MQRLTLTQAELKHSENEAIHMLADNEFYALPPIENKGIDLSDIAILKKTALGKDMDRGAVIEIQKDKQKTTITKLEELKDCAAPDEIRKIIEAYTQESYFAASDAFIAAATQLTENLPLFLTTNDHQQTLTINLDAAPKPTITWKAEGRMSIKSLIDNEIIFHVQDYSIQLELTDITPDKLKQLISANASKTDSIKEKTSANAALEIIANGTFPTALFKVISITSNLYLYDVLNSKTLPDYRQTKYKDCFNFPTLEEQRLTTKLQARNFEPS